MGAPAKKRKLNDAKASPVAARNLDFFFNKPKQDVATTPLKAVAESKKNISESLTDEELARKLQAEWAAEDNGIASASQEAKDVEEHISEPASLGNTAGAIKEGTLGPEDPIKSEATAMKPKTNPFESKTKNTLTLQSVGDAEETITSEIPFDQSPLTFDPSKYVTELQSHWAAEGGNATYALLVRCFVLVNSTTSRIKIVDTIVNLLRVIIESDPSSLLPTVRSIPATMLFLPWFEAYFERIIISMSNFISVSDLSFMSYSYTNLSNFFLSGMACNKCHKSALHISRARSRWFSNIQSSEKCMRIGRQILKVAI